METLGEVFIPEQDVETSYTGDSGDSQLSLQYYRNKAREFQAFMEEIDTTYAIALSLASDPGVADSLRNDMLDTLDQIEAKKATIRTTAQGINLAAEAINAVGGRFPELSVPSTLQGLGLPFVIPAAAVAAFAAAVALIAWGSQIISGVNERLKTSLLYDNMDDETKSRVAAAQVQAETSQKAAEVSPWTALSNIGQYLLIGAAIWIGYNVWKKGK